MINDQKNVRNWGEKALHSTTLYNTYSGVNSDELVQYGDYHQPWKLDSGASGHYCGKNTGVLSRWKQQNGIKVQVADGTNMDQVKEGKAPFDGLPEDTADVQIIPNMPKPLVSCGKIAK